jgi:UDP-N-acetylmuramoyl-tripeptide--D-alanyl-D-alanine ligase
MRVDELVQVVGGELLTEGKNGLIKSVSTDTRSLNPGDVFFALKGENFNGNTFLEKAFQQGASGAVVDSNKFKGKLEIDGFVIRVKDTLEALGRLATYVRNLVGFKVVAITGSTGKTTTRDFLASILRRQMRAVSPPGNFNNEVGVPLTLLQADQRTEVAVVEMAMRGLGQIAYLARLARPDIGVVTNVGLTHYELLGSEEKILEAKAELVENLNPSGWAILNGDDLSFAYLSRQSRAKVVKFGFKNRPQFTAEKISLDDQARARFVLVTPEGKVDIKLAYPGRHCVENALAASAAAWQLGLSHDDIKQGLEEAKLSSMRMEVTKAGGVTLINDAYNANPASMLAALEVLRNFKAQRRWACLGDMLELGAIAQLEHRRLGKKLAQYQFDGVLLLGEMAGEVSQAAIEAGFSEKRLNLFNDYREAAHFLLNNLESGDAALFKASRALGLERVVELVKEGLS